MKITHFGTHIEVDDFRAKWKRARMSALSYFHCAASDETDELEILLSLPAVLYPLVLDVLKYECKHMGRQIQMRFGRPLHIDEVSYLFSQSDVPCFCGSWKTENHPHSKFLYRAECKKVSEKICCDYWKTAGQGIMEGLGENTRMARHQSIGYGDAGCLDYLYTPTFVKRELGLVPSYLKLALAPLIKELKARGLELDLHGFSEQELHWSLTSTKEKLKIDELRLMESEVQLELMRRFPRIRLNKKRNLVSKFS